MDKKLVLVRWLDAQDHQDTWVDAKDAEDFTDVMCQIVSVGWQVKKTEKYLTIASDFDEADGDYGTVRKIALGMIQEITDLN